MTRKPPAKLVEVRGRRDLLTDNRRSQGGRPARVKAHGKKREHGQNSCDFGMETLSPVRDPGQGHCVQDATVRFRAEGPSAPGRAVQSGHDHRAPRCRVRNPDVAAQAVRRLSKA
jgi:hypothetical protein